MSHADTALETSARVLAAASAVFAEVGYRAATLREIAAVQRPMSRR